MQIAKDTVVSFDYELTNDEGAVLDSSKNSQPLTYLHGSGNIIPGLENALDGKDSGEQVKVSIPPAEAYGPRRDDLTQEVEREKFSEVDDLAVGMKFRVPTQEGQPLVVTVVDVNDDKVTVDGNHELAGETLHFDVTIRDVREATAEELSHGHAHTGEEH